MSNYLNTMIDETQEINSEAYALRELSRAFYVTGNIIMGKDLYDISCRLIESSGNISKAVGQEITDRNDQAQQATANMVNAALAMCRPVEA